MANYPEESGILKFNIRVSPPPPRMDHLPPGAMTSYVANLKPGDKITVFGPYGDFFVKDTPAEKIWIGGGAGMAPLRSHIFDELLRKDSKTKMSYWYGARSLREMFYTEELDRLAEKYENFSWHVALSDPRKRTIGKVLPASSTSWCWKTTLKIILTPRIVSTTCVGHR